MKSAKEEKTIKAIKPLLNSQKALKNLPSIIQTDQGSEFGLGAYVQDTSAILSKGINLRNTL